MNQQLCVRRFMEGISYYSDSPNMASVKTATKPMDSMNQCTESIRYVMAAPTAHRTSIKSRYDWKSVQLQKYLKSRSFEKVK